MSRPCTGWATWSLRWATRMPPSITSGRRYRPARNNVIPSYDLANIYKFYGEYEEAINLYQTIVRN